MDKNLEQAVEQLSKGVAPETVHVLWLTAETLEKTASSRIAIRSKSLISPLNPLNA